MYRTITSQELLSRLNNNPILSATIKGKNIFEYDNNTEYLHFFYIQNMYFIKKRKKDVLL